MGASSSSPQYTSLGTGPGDFLLTEQEEEEDEEDEEDEKEEEEEEELFVATANSSRYNMVSSTVTNTNIWLVKRLKEKSRIRETKHLSTKNTPKPDFFEKRKKSSKTQKLKNV